MHIGDHANDGPRSRGIDQEAAPEGVFVLEIPPRKGLIDDHCRGGGAAVCIGDGAPAQQPDAERLEIAGQDDAHFLIGTRRAGRRRIALDLEGGVVGHSAERQEVHGSGSGHAGKGAQLLQRFVEECTVTRVLGLGLRCGGPRECDAEREHLVRTEARADQIESSDSVIVICAEKVLFDDLPDVTRLLHTELVEDVEAIGNGVAS